MAAPKYEVIQKTYQNPHATKGLKLNVMVVSNTADEELEKNIRHNAAEHGNWVQNKEEHDGIAVFIGGGGSIVDYVDEIINLQGNGATIIAMNGSSKWARENGIYVDWQVIVDAKEETSQLVDHNAEKHFFASQCNKATLENVDNLTLAHLATPGIEDLFPAERVKMGGYVLLGGGSTVGNASLALAYSQGFRDFHIFGYDSSHTKGKSHGYHQAMNTFMPTTEITWAGKTFEVSVAMKAQAEKFQQIAKRLKAGGCDLHVYGDGLLQTIYNTKYEDLSEREKYQIMWQYDCYREVSPGEKNAEFFIEHFKPEGLILDFGCGTGRAGIVFYDSGFDVLLIDFADNCRDHEALKIPFLQWDLTKPLEVKSDYGYCTDVMEHLPTEAVESVISNIMNASGKVYFQISTTEDHYGQLIDHHLHLTVKPHSWWKDLFISLGYEVEWEVEQDYAALFYVINPDRRETCQ